MKKLLTLSAVALLAASTYGQGLVTFNNRDSANGILAPVTDVDGTTLLTGTAAKIALLGGPTTADAAILIKDGGGTRGTLAMLASPNSGATAVAFQTQRPGYAAVGTDSTRQLDSVGFNADAKLQLVAWTGSATTWTDAFTAALSDRSIHVGASAAWTVHTGADALAFPPVNTGMAGFSLMSIAPIPEPSTMALAGLGAAALLIFRRRK